MFKRKTTVPRFCFIGSLTLLITSSLAFFVVEVLRLCGVACFDINTLGGIFFVGFPWICAVSFMGVCFTLRGRSLKMDADGNELDT